jgi:putative addiction module antidote
MTMKTKVRRIGNSLGVVLPKEAVQAMKVKEGATLYITEAPECSLQITPERKGFEEMMQMAEEGMQTYRNALRQLAK